MKKFASISVVLLLFLLVVPGVFAHPNDGRNRIIARSASPFDRSLFRLKGCEITHELNDATSLSCPKNVTVPNSEQDTVLHILDLSSDAQIKANQVWPNYTGTGVTVAVLDTGIDYNHLQLGSSSGFADYVNGHCFAVTAADCGNGFFDDLGHGTHVSGIITSDGIVDAFNGAFSKGVAPGTNIWMAKVCDANGNCYTSDIAAAIQYIVNNHIAKVMNISLGGGGTRNANCDGDYLASQINWAYNNGVVSVIAAGNSGNNIISSPACASNAIAVAAVNSSDNLASFSSFGNALANHGVAAPGVSIYSTVPTGSCSLCSSTGYAYLSGTSMATPHVSATVALMLQKNPNLTPTDIRSIIFNSANCLNNKYGSCSNTYIGYGRIDANKAVNSTPSNTPFLSLSTNPSTITTSQTSTITVFTSDTNAGVLVSFSTNLGTLSASACTSDSAGKCLVNLSSSTAGTATITASAPEYTGASASVTIIFPQLSVSANPSTITTSQSSTITASTPNAQPGIVISFSTNLGSLNASSCVSDSNGKCSVSFSSTTTGTAKISASAANYTTASTTVTITSPPKPYLSVTVSTDKTSYIRNSVAHITVAVSANPAPIKGASVVLTVTNPNGGTTKSSKTTGSNGQATFNYSISRIASLGTYTVTAQASKTGYNLGTGSTTFTVKK